MKDVSSKKPINLSMAIVALVALGFALVALEKILMPFVVAFFIVCLSGPSISIMLNKGIPKIIALLIIVGFVGVFIMLVGKGFASQIPKFDQKADKYIARFHEMTEKVIPREHWETIELDKWKEKIPLRSLISTVVKQVGNFFGIIGTSLLVLVYLVFLLMEREAIIYRICRAGESSGDRVLKIIENIQLQIESYFLGKTLISLVTGLVVTLVLWAFGVEFFLLWGLITFLLNFVPNIGSIIATIFPILVALLQTKEVGDALEPCFSYTQVVILSGLLILIQLTVGNLLEPRLIGNRLKLSPLVIFVSFIFWGWLWGIPGIMLSAPIMVTLRIILENIESTKPLAMIISNAQPEKEKAVKEN